MRACTSYVLTSDLCSASRCFGLFKAAGAAADLMPMLKMHIMDLNSAEIQEARKAAVDGGTQPYIAAFIEWVPNDAKAEAAADPAAAGQAGKAKKKRERKERQEKKGK